MFLVNKHKELLANSSQMIKSFKTEEEFNAWSATLTDPVEDMRKYLVIKKYNTPGKGQIATLEVDGDKFILEKISDKVNYFTIESETPMTVTPKWTATGTMEYSADGGAFTPITNNATTSSAKKISFRGDMTTNNLSIGQGNENNWVITGGSNIVLKGDLTTVLKPEGAVDQLGDYAFKDMFKDSANIISAENLILPSTQLSQWCYFGLFQGCSSLITPPKLPALNMVFYCYGLLFLNCSSLASAPELPSMNLAPGCYGGMFQGCISLERAPTLSATVIPEQGYTQMFEGCHKLQSAPELPATELEPHCYEYMFAGCSSMLYPPTILPSMLAPGSAYSFMFMTCDRLLWPPIILAEEQYDYCFDHMFTGAGDGQDLFSESQSDIHPYPLENNSNYEYQDFSLSVPTFTYNQIIFGKEQKPAKPL